MRDNHEGYVEIVNAYEREGQYLGAIRVNHLGEPRSLEFGVSQAGYYALRRILNLRPFDSMPGVRYRFFFTGGYGKVLSAGTDPFEMHMRVEQGCRAEGLTVQGPKDLLANLLWFMQLKSPDETVHLRQLDKDPH